MGTFEQIKDALTDTAQGVKERAMQVRDAVVETARDTRDKAAGMADQVMAGGDRLRAMMTGEAEADALELLKKDHEMVSSMFEQIEALDGKAADLREGLFSQLKYDLSIHALVEEKLFYPALERRAGQAQKEAEDAKERRDLVNEAYEEHNVVKMLLAQLAAMDMNSDEWKAKLTVLKENVQHHVEEEEGDLFDLAREVMDKDQLRQLGARMQEEKLALAEAGKPDEQDEALAFVGEGATAQKRQAAKPARAAKSGRTSASRSHRVH